MIKNICFCLFVVFSFLSCEPNKPATSIVPESGDNLSNSALFAFPLPTSLEVSETLKNANVEYSSSIMNNANTVNKYISTKDKAINLGIYTADICYAITYDMKQDALKYLKASKKLLDDLGIVSPFTNQIIQGFNDDSQNKDSILIITILR